MAVSRRRVKTVGKLRWLGYTKKTPMTDENEHTEPSPEYAAERRRRAVLEYTGTSPQVIAGQIPEEKILGWQEALNTPDLQPAETWAAGWIDAELAMSYSVHREVLEDDEQGSREAIGALILRAREKFLHIKDHESLQVSALLRSQATLAAASMAVWADMMVDGDVSLSTQKYNAEQAVGAVQLMAYYAENPSVEASMWADTLTFISIISMRTDMIAFLCPPRLTSPYIDGYHRKSALLFSDQTFLNVRVGSRGHSSAIHVPYEVLGHERYSSHKLGTILAMVQMEEAINHAKFGRIKECLALEPRTQKAQRHSDRVYEDLVGRINEELALGATTHDEPDDAREWVATLQSGRNPYVVSPERTDAVISPLELQVLDETISVADALELGWLYAEVAFGRAIDPTVPVAQIRGDIDRAEEIFSLALEKADEQDVFQFCEASLAHGVAWMQRIILCSDQLTAADIEYYRQVLLFTGRRASARHAELPPTDPEATALAVLMCRTTLCLLIMSEGGGTIALITPPRQRAKEGWDVTVWSETLDGFMPGQYGRLRITEKEDASSLSDGIVTVTHQHLGFTSKQKKGAMPFRVFTALADAAEDAPLTKKFDGQDRRRVIEKAWKAVAARIAATEV